jgi:hypothetical protein
VAGAAGKARIAVKWLCLDTAIAIPDGIDGGGWVSALASTGRCPPKQYARRCGYGGLPLGARVTDVDASVRVTHPSVRELDVLLVSPVGIMVPLAVRSAGSGADLGAGATGCNGQPATFDDESAGSMRAATAPFVGPFRPAQPLAAFDGSFGSGDWRFYFGDSLAGNQGVVEAVALRLAYRVRSKAKSPRTSQRRGAAMTPWD